MNYKVLYFLFFFGIIWFSEPCYGQETANSEPTDDLGNVSDAFQENFFEALKQKGIENYELALSALEKAEKVIENNPENQLIVFFERAKNLTKLKQYEDAEVNFKKVIEAKPDQLDVMVALYDLYYLQKNYDAAIPLVKKLIVFDDDYKEDLANLYSRTKQYDKAIEVLDVLDLEWGESDYRNRLRTNIYKATGNSTKALESLVHRINSNPKKEKEYLNLIFLYSEQGDVEKAFETAQELLKKEPKSQLVHLALYKFYLDQGNERQALNSMEVVFKSNEIVKESKYTVMEDFISFVKTRPQYEPDLEKMITLFAGDNNGKVYEKLGAYYVAKKQKDRALEFYQRGVKKDPDDFSLIKNTLLLQLDFKNFDEAAILSARALEIFPAQALLYLLNGVANIGLQKADLAIESLEMGVDFLYDDPRMERDFYTELSKAYFLKGDTQKSEEYTLKASEIVISN